MKQSQMLIPTLRDVPAGADVTSHQLLLRAGFIRQNAAGIYSFLPMGNRVLKKVENIVREEMEKAGAVELLMPAMQPAELWHETGRWSNFGPELMRLRDRHDREFALGATHEEVITSLVRDEVNSYKKLPLTLFQIQSKFRDEKRPRFGLLRGREFMMKDAYSFHATKESLDEVYQAMFNAYSNIFERCGLNFRAVIADSGAMGGKDTHEFMVLSEVGEDTIAYSDSSSFAANIEMAPVQGNYERKNEEMKQLEKIETTEKKSIEEVAEYLDLQPQDCIKSLLFTVDDKYVLILCRGDHDINDIKVKNYYNAASVELASPEKTVEVLGCPIGSIGPINISDDVEVLADEAVKYLVNGTCGANEEHYHYVNVNLERDFQVSEFTDLRFIQEGDPSPDGMGTIKFAKGIEVGHVFKLGTFYSESMNATYLDENGRSNPMIMGCYGIGVSRTMASIIEQYHDDRGIIWPASVAPFDVHLIPINVKNDPQRELTEKIYDQLKEAGFSVLYDDRAERPGVKFADSDLFGIPVRITVGKKAEEEIVEFKPRKTGDMQEVSVENLVNEITKNLSYT